MAGRHPIRKPLQETVIPQPVAICSTKLLCGQKVNPKSSENLKSINRNIRWTMDEKENPDLNGNFAKDEVLHKLHDAVDSKESGNRSQASFVISFDENKSAKKWSKKKKTGSLQDAFHKFRQSKQNEIKQCQLMKERELATKCDTNQMWQLRMKFVETAKSYFGVPYAKKYHQPGTPEYNAPLFLDCCALVRQVLRDLKEDFGFDIGPWNQAYQYDTLPITIDDEKDMKPGDLVFISGIYYNEKSKKQRHDMVHVEIWAGDGPKTIGARWQKGKVQVFDSYTFAAKSYHSMQYYFKSIDTWLQGICKSYCPEHKWSSTLYEPGRKSIFAVQHQEEPEELDEGAGDTEDDLIESDGDDAGRTGLWKEGGTEDCRVMGGDRAKDGKGKDTSLAECDGLNLLKGRPDEESSDSRCKHQGKGDVDVEMRCWTHIEKSPVHDMAVSKIEEICWESVESKHASSSQHVVENSDDKCGVVLLDRSESLRIGLGSDKLNDVVEDIFHCCDYEDKDNEDQCRDNVDSCGMLEDNGSKPNFAASHCERDNANLNLVCELGNKTEKDHGVNILVGVEERTQTCDNFSLRVDESKRTSFDDDIESQDSDYDYKIMSQHFCRMDQDIGLEGICGQSSVETDREDTTSMDDWPCFDVTTTTSDESANVLIAQESRDKTDPGLHHCHKTHYVYESSGHSNCHSMHCNHGNCGSTQKVGNLCSSDLIRDNPRLVSNVTFGGHCDKLSGAEPVDGDDGKPQNAASNGQSRGESGRKSPSKKTQMSKGKNREDVPKGGGGGGGVGGGGGGSSSVSSRASAKDFSGPAFYIGGGNGVALVEEPLLARGWHRIQDRQSDGFKLKWVEVKSHINYNSFRPGDQLVNRIPNSHLLATKTGLYTTLRDYERLTGRTSSKTKPSRVLKMQDFFAESYVLDVKAERETFFQTFKEGEIWICKPNGMNQGKGIYLVRDTEELRKKYEEKENNPKKSARPSVHGSRLIQRYIPNPLLLEGKKFDVRTYMLIACTNPFMVLFHTGYLRLACDEYDADSTDLHRHLTNQYQQKKHPSYQDVKEETVWSMERFNDHVNELAAEKGLPKDWVMGYFHKQMSKIMLHCFNAVKNKLDTKLGVFDLLGFDFLIDTDFKVWLIEINVNPALHTNCEVLRNMLPAMIEETLDIVLEVFEKSKRNRPITPLSSQRNFKMLHNGSSSSGSSSGERVRPVKSTSPRRSSPTRQRPGARSSSPPKRVIGGAARPVSVRQNVTKVVVKSTSKEAVAVASKVNSKDAS